MFTATLKNNFQNLKDKIIRPAFDLFYSFSVVSNILFNPVKLLVVMSLYQYWKDVSQRGLSFVTTNLDGRYRDTEKILKAIDLPNKDFIPVVLQVMHAMHEGDLKERLQFALAESENVWDMALVQGVAHASFLAANTAFSLILGQFHSGLGIASFLVLEALHADFSVKALYDMMDNHPLPRLRH